MRHKPEAVFVILSLKRTTCSYLESAPRYSNRTSATAAAININTTTADTMLCATASHRGMPRCLRYSSIISPPRRAGRPVPRPILCGWAAALDSLLRQASMKCQTALRHVPVPSIPLAADMSIARSTYSGEQKAELPGGDATAPVPAAAASLISQAAKCQRRRLSQAFESCSQPSGMASTGRTSISSCFPSRRIATFTGLPAGHSVRNR